MFENLSVAPLVGRGADVMTFEWRRWIAGVTCDARLVVIDTLRRFHQLDENDGGHMAGLLAYMEQLCRENSTTVLFLHHTSKAGALNGGDAQLDAAIDHLLKLVEEDPRSVPAPPEYPDKSFDYP